MLSFFPRDVFDEIWDLIELVSEGFLFYSVMLGVDNNNSIKKKNARQRKLYLVNL